MDSGPYVVFRMCNIVVGEGSLVPLGTSEWLMCCWLGSSGQIWGFSIHMLLPEQPSRQLPTSPRPQYSAALQTAYTPPATHSHLNLNFWLWHWTAMLSIWADCRLADHLCVWEREMAKKIVKDTKHRDSLVKFRPLPTQSRSLYLCMGKKWDRGRISRNSSGREWEWEKVKKEIQRNEKGKEVNKRPRRYFSCLVCILFQKEEP